METNQTPVECRPSCLTKRWYHEITTAIGIVCPNTIHIPICQTKNCKTQWDTYFNSLKLVKV